MYKMEKMKEMMTMTILVTLVVLLFSSTLTMALPTKRSSARDIMMSRQGQHSSDFHMSDGILRDFMMYMADANGDNKLSEAEIAWFYRNIVLYTDYVAAHYGREFIDIADADHDGLLDANELLLMIVEIDAAGWTKRR